MALQQQLTTSSISFIVQIVPLRKKTTLIVMKGAHIYFYMYMCRLDLIEFLVQFFHHVCLLYNITDPTIILDYSYLIIFMIQVIQMM